MWVFFVAVAWHLWYFVFDIWSYMLPLTFGMVVGVLSGLSQPRSFLACLCGFSINALLFIFVFFNVAAGLILFGILSGLVAVAGAVLRKMLLNERTEDLYLKSWQQMLLIGGVSILADYFTIIGTYQEFFVYHRFLTYLKSFIPVVVGLFISGLYAGVFNNVEYKTVMKSVIRVTLASHLVYLVYMGYLFFEENITWRPFLFVPLMGLYLVLVLVGMKIGYRFRDRIKIHG
jgi:ABC-type iron transport system FetAB permease component